jgi:broad specificity phosphatase PhoE
MSSPLQIYVIRHGETAWSLSGQHTGRTDLPLTPNGEAMARALAPMLAGLAFSRVLCSPRLRARSTCELAGLGPHAETEPLLAEWDYGDFEGLRTSEIQQKHPAWDIWTDGCPGGEMPVELSQRADKVIAKLCEGQGRIVLFTHGQFGRVLAARWIGLAVIHGQHFAIDPASISILGYEAAHPQRRVISLWNARPDTFR